MNIYDSDIYSNKIVRALIANIDTSMDPEGQGRVQIYFPESQTDIADKFNIYKNATNKQDLGEKDYFPWAVCLIDIATLKNGSEVYVNNINNDVGQYIIIGIAKTSLANRALENKLQYAGNLNGNNVVELAMPNILHEEIGLDYEDYPNNISDDRYGRINGNDEGALSIGLIQWHDTRAFDLLFAIANAKTNWRDCWTDKNLDVYKALDTSVITGDSSMLRQSCSGLIITEGTAIWNSIYNMLTSEEGKKTQLEMSSADTSTNLDYLNENWTINNIAILIMLLDIQNQYGRYVNSVLNGCIDKAQEISLDGKGIMEQLDEFMQYWKNRTTLYISRRDRTYAYINGLYDQGKLVNQTDLTSIGAGQMFVVGFIPRTTEPSPEDYWYSEERANRGYSMWSNGGNCAYYAWARASEILGRDYDGSAGNGVDYGDPDQYETGDIPRQGAIITWYKNGGGAGHVAIVEKVSEDGQTIWTSESGYQSFLFKYKERPNDGNWGASSYYTFRNFKYLI